MSADRGSERRFIDETDGVEFLAQDAGQALDALQAWFARFESDLQGSRVLCEGLKEQAGLARQACAIDAELRRGAQAWPAQWASLQEAHALAEAFGDRMLLLVFGKFNAGKSSFCNFIADRYLAHGKQAGYFYLDAGRIVETADRFQVGGTETTVRLQGVRLGEKLVLLDTPGLHSMSRDNAALTRRLANSADGVLWLTSSTSPGQVQELEELGRELRRDKVLLPVVTRSDMYEEDEIDGELRPCLRNKTEQNRALQEADVRTRALGKLAAMGVDPALLRPPVSVSVRAAREQGLTPAALAEAGFERLYASLLAIAGPALSYKRRKRAEIFLHYLEEQVLGATCGEALRLLAGLKASLRTELDLLARRQEQAGHAVWRRVMPALPGLLDRHAATRTAGELCGEVSQWIFEAFAAEAHGQWSDYDIALDPARARIELDGDADFEDVVFEDPGAAGNVSRVVGVSYERLYAALEKAMRKTLHRLSSEMAAQCRAAIERMMARAAGLEDMLGKSARDLSGLKRDLRSSQ